VAQAQPLDDLGHVLAGLHRMESGVGQAPADVGEHGQGE
jgi:hypothetical protein